MIPVSGGNRARICLLSVLLGWMLPMPASWGVPHGLFCADDAEASAEETRFATETLRGRVVWMAEALERRFGIQSVPEASERILAVETRQGELYPLVEDVRGRAFRRDRRLRELKDCEVFVRRFHGSPMIQVINLYTHENDARYELDYWCEICAITMFELKACDCCQGDIELRRRLAP